MIINIFYSEVLKKDKNKYITLEIMLMEAEKVEKS